MPESYNCSRTGRSALPESCKLSEDPGFAKKFDAATFKGDKAEPRRLLRNSGIEHDIRVDAIGKDRWVRITITGGAID
jgi:hypothetical protein